MKLEDYSKQELIVAIRHLYKCEEKLMMELPIIKYNAMCDKAKVISEQSSLALQNDDIEKAMLLIDKSNALYKKANSFIDRVHKRQETT